MPLPPHLAKLSKSEMEALCVNCGLCCVAAVPVEKGIKAIVPELHCKHLQMTDGKSCCEVYDQRHDVAKGWCNTIESAIEKGILPNACPYVVGMKSYNGTVMLDDRFFRMVRPQIQKAVAAEGKPAWASEEMWKSFVTGDGQ